MLLRGLLFCPYKESLTASPRMVLYGFEQESIQPLHGWATTSQAMTSHMRPGCEGGQAVRLWQVGAGDKGQPQCGLMRRAAISFFIFFLPLMAML